MALQEIFGGVFLVVMFFCVFSAVFQSQWLCAVQFFSSTSSAQVDGRRTSSIRKPWALCDARLAVRMSTAQVFVGEAPMKLKTNRNH